MGQASDRIDGVIQHPAPRAATRSSVGGLLRFCGPPSGNGGRSVAYPKCVPMTARKADIPLNSRLTAFVSRESGAAELQVSPATWDAMEEVGQLPKPYLLGPRKNIKRWLWAEVVKRIAGEGDQEQQEPFFRGLASGTTKERKREVAA